LHRRRPGLAATDWACTVQQTLGFRMVRPKPAYAAKFAFKASKNAFHLSTSAYKKIQRTSWTIHAY